MRAARSSRPVNTTARPSDLEQRRRGRGALEDRAVRRERAGQRHQPADRRDRIVERADHRAVDPAERLLQPLGERAALDVDGVEVQQRLQLAQQRAHAAGGVEVLHVALADRLQVDQHRRLVGDLVEARRARSLMPSRPATAVRCTMALVEPPTAISTRMAFSTDFSVMTWRGVMPARDQPHRRLAGLLRRDQPVGMHGRDGGGAGQRHAERLGDAGHGRGRAHHRAGAGRHRQPPLDRLDLVRVDRCRRGTSPRSRGSRCRRRAAGPCGGRSTSARSRAGSPAARPRPRPSAAPARSCRSRRSAPPRPSAGRRSSPRCPSPSGCGTSCWSG